MNSNNNKVLLAVIVALSVGIFGAYKWKSNKSVDPQTDWQQWNPQDQGWQQWTPPTTPPGTPPGTPPTSPPGTPPQGSPRNYTETIEFAKRNNKQVLLIFGAEWCQWCKKMKSETLNNSSVQSKMSAYVYYYVDTDKEKDIAKKYKVSGIPYYAIINPTNESIVRQGNGFKSSTEFVAWMDGGSGLLPRNPKNRVQPPSNSPG